MRNLNAMELVMVGGAADIPKPPSTDNTNTNNNNTCKGGTQTESWEFGWGLIHAGKTTCVGGGGSAPASGSSTPAPPSSSPTPPTSGGGGG